MGLSVRLNYVKGRSGLKPLGEHSHLAPRAAGPCHWPSLAARPPARAWCASGFWPGWPVARPWRRGPRPAHEARAGPSQGWPVARPWRRGPRPALRAQAGSRRQGRATGHPWRRGPRPAHEARAGGLAARDGQWHGPAALGARWLCSPKGFRPDLLLHNSSEPRAHGGRPRRFLLRRLGQSRSRAGGVVGSGVDGHHGALGSLELCKGQVRPEAFGGA